MRNTVAQIVFGINGKHLGRFAVAAVFLLSFFVSGAWAECVTWKPRIQCVGGNASCTISCTYPNYNYTLSVSGGAMNMCDDGGTVSGSCAPANPESYAVQISGTYYRSCAGTNYSGRGDFVAIRCNTVTERDSVVCVNEGNVWDSSKNPPCQEPCDARCQCEESGGTWNSTNGGYCVPDCQSQFCCDSLNQNLPVETDTTWEGCVATDPANDKCVVLPTTADNTGSTTAECTAKSRYRVCTTSYIWSRTAGQCAPVSTNNCVNVDIPNDERCTNVLCEAYQYRSVSALQYNGSTQCYEGQQMVQDMMVCDNGIREERGRTTENFQVCDSYLEANNISIQDYLSGQNGGSSVVGGNSAGTGGGNTSGPSVPCVGNGCSSNPYDGGKSVNALGDTVQNSASPYLGNVWTPTQNVVTSYDSTTGITTVVQNSQGGDSVAISVKPTGVRCLGVSGGVATLTNGYSTWTCAGVQSCSQAVISASINGGSCSASSSGIFNDGYNSDKIPLIFDENGNAILTSENDNLERAMQQLASVMNGIANKDTLNRQKVHQIDRNHQDSLWKATFGEDLDAVRNMERYIASASSANSQAIASAASQITSANSHALSANSQAISAMAENLSGKLTTLNNSVKSASSANSQAIASATSAVNTAVGNAASDVASSIDNFRSANSQALNSVASMYRDSVHRTNTNLIGIHNALDTNGIIQNDLNKINSSIGGVASSVDSAFRISMDEWYNDKLKITMDSNATRIVDALDALQVEVQLDSIKIDMPKDSTLDSIHADLSKYTAPLNPQVSNDTLDFGRLYGEGWDSSFSDTSLVYDSTLGNEIKSYNWIGGNNFTDSGFVDSVESTLDDKLDSTGLMYNARSDSMTEAYADTMMKYGGLDSAGRALNDFFASNNNSCQCFDVSVTYSALGADYTSNIRFSQYLCELKLFGELTAIDLMKTVLRIMTSIFCVFLLIRAIGQRDKK